MDDTNYEQDMSLEEANNFVTAENKLAVYSNAYEDVARKEAIRESVENTDFFSSDTAKAFGTRFGEANFLNEGWEKIKLHTASMGNYDDKRFKENNSDDRVKSILKENNLSADDFLELRGANNPIAEGAIIDYLIRKKENNEFAQMHLSDTLSTTASVVGSIVDIDTLLIGPMAGILGKGAKLSQVAKATFAVETAGVPLKAAMREDYEVLRDGLLDITVGVIVDTSVARFFGNRLGRDLEIQRQQAVIEKQSIAEFDLENKAYWKEQELKSLEKEQIDIANKAKGKLSAKNKARLDELREEKLTKQKADEELTISARERKQAEVEARAKSDDLLTAEKELDRLKEIELTLKAQGKKIDTAKMRKNSEAIIDAKKKVDDAVLAESDARMKKKQAESKQRRLEENRRIENTIKTMEQNLKPEIDRLRTELTDIATKQTASSTAIDVKHLEDAITSLRINYPDLASDIIDSFDRIKRNNIKFKSGMTAQQKMITLAAGGLLLGTSAQADDFSGDSGNFLTAQYVALAVATYVLGGKAFSIIKQGNLRNSISKISGKIGNVARMSEYANSVEGNKVTKYVADLHNKANTAFNSTYQEIIGYGDAKAKIIADKLLFNPITGKVGSADVEKMQMLHAEQAKVSYILKASYREWLKESGIGTIDRYVDAAKLRDKFNKEVSDMIDGTSNSTSSASKAAAEQIQPIFKQALEYAEEVGVLGAKRADKFDNYLPRLWKFNSMHELIRGLDKDGMDTLTKEFSNMIKGPNSIQTAQKMMNWFKNVKNFNGGQADEILERLEDFLKNDADLQKARESLQTSADKTSRLKDRLDIDFTKLSEDLKLRVNGIEMTIDKATMVERDINKISDSYLNTMYGSIALAKRDYPSVAMLRDEIKAIGGEAGEALDVTVSLILGQPLRVNNKQVHEWVSTLKNMTFVVALPFVAFSMIPEAIKTVANTGLSVGLNSLAGSIKVMNKDTELFKTMTELSGLATHRIRDRLDVKGLDNSEIGEIGVSSWHAKASAAIAHQAAKSFGLVGGSDILQKMTLLKSNTELGLWVNDMGDSLLKSRLDSYGLDDEAKAMFKDDFKFNSKGQLTSINTDGWSYSKRAKYNDIVFRMNQEVTPEVVLGTIGRWTKDNEVGRLFSFLLSYPMNLYGNQAVKDAQFMDRRTISNTVFTFAGTYLGLMAKYEATDKEYTHEDLVKYSIMSLPSLGGVTGMVSIMSPSTVQKSSAFADDIKAIAGMPFEAESDF